MGLRCPGGRYKVDELRPAAGIPTKRCSGALARTWKQIPPSSKINGKHFNHEKDSTNTPKIHQLVSIVTTITMPATVIRNFDVLPIKTAFLLQP